MADNTNAAAPVKEVKQKAEKKPQEPKKQQEKKDKKEVKPKIDINALQKPEYIDHRVKVLEDYLKSNPPAKKGIFTKNRVKLKII